MRLLLEVDVLDGRSGRKPGPVEDDELETPRKWPLRAPRRPAAGDAAVHQDEALHRRIIQCNELTTFALIRAEKCCYKLAGMLPLAWDRIRWPQPRVCCSARPAPRCSQARSSAGRRGGGGSAS